MKTIQYKSSTKIAALLFQVVFLIGIISIFFLLAYLLQNGVITNTEQMFDWKGMGFLIVLELFLAVCFACTMIYLTLAAGRNEDDDNIHLYRIDYIPTELLFVLYIIFLAGMIMFCVHLDRQDFGISSTLILNGSLVFLTDGVMLTLYFSFVRKIKAQIMLRTSLISWATRTLKAGIKKRKFTSRAVIFYMMIMGGALFLAAEAFGKGKLWAAALLILLLAAISIYLLQQALQRKTLLEGIIKISGGELDYKLQEKEYSGDYREIAEKINTIGEGLSRAVGENVKSERLKTELITNVSHDIKTPLTSIINYIDLIKREDLQNEKIENYISVLEKKSMRLKQLTDDLAEVSRISSGSIRLDMQPIDMVELIYQTGGEFNDIFENRGLTVVTRLPRERVMISADGNRLWRVVQNLYNNVAKYAMPNTRVYVDLKVTEHTAEFSIKDISEQEITKMPQELSRRFVRGDEARQTEGNGLGLSIAENLTALMGGKFEIRLDGDLFTAAITFPLIKQDNGANTERNSSDYRQ